MYVAGQGDDAIAVFHRDPGTGLLTFVEMVKDGSAGVRGIGGIVGLAVSSGGSTNDEYVFAAGGTDTAAVFARDAVTGRLTMLQRLRDGAADVSGLGLPTGVAVSDDGRFFYVTSGGLGDNVGRVSVFQIAQSTPPRSSYLVEHSGMEFLRVQSAGSNDSVSLGEVAALQRCKTLIGQ